MKIFQAVAASAIGLLAALPATALSPVPPNSLEPGHSAVWYDEDKPGTGWVLEMLAGDQAAAYWFGFDEQGAPTWRVGAGERVPNDPMAGGYSLQFDALFSGSGARFGNAFDPDDVVLTPAGGARMTFLDCDSGSIREADAERSEPLDRLTQTMGAGCASINGVPGFPVRPYAGQSGAWYGPERDGEGITLQWIASDQAVVFWFTYDLEGNPFWLSGVGAEEDGLIVFPVMHSATLGPEGQAQLSEWGSLTLDLGCNDGTLTWASVVEGFGDGAIDLSRLTSLASPSCPYLAPELTDLYAIELTELPAPEQGRVRAKSIADDGTVLGVQENADGWEAVTFLPGTEAWWPLAGTAVDPEQPMLITPNAERVIASEPANPVTNASQPLEWTQERGWVSLPGFDSGENRLVFGSADRSVLTGAFRDGSDDAVDQGWVWSSSAGQQFLPPTYSDNPTVAVSASNDGTVVVGIEKVPVLGAPVPDVGHQAGTVATLWIDGAPNQLLDDEDRLLGIAALCSANCQIIYGWDTNGVDLDSPRIAQPWFWRPDGRFGVFERLAYDGQTRHDLLATTSDGTLVIGGSVIPSPFPTVGQPSEAFIWTQVTGVVFIDELLGELGFTAGPLAEVEFRPVAVSAGGRHILVEDTATGRAVTVTLTPK